MLSSAAAWQGSAGCVCQCCGCMQGGRVVAVLLLYVLHVVAVLLLVHAYVVVLLSITSVT